MRGENCDVDATALARHALVVNQAVGFGIDGDANVILGMKISCYWRNDATHDFRIENYVVWLFSPLETVMFCVTGGLS
jgi:hypothetical protein